jgi:hypothetical protein
MATLILRNTKGSALTFDELDSNFLALDSDITSINNTLSSGVGLGADSVNSLIDARIDSDNFVDLTTVQTITGAKTFNGGITVSSGLIANSLTYPTADGNTGEFLKTDGAGNLTFDVVTSYDSAKVQGQIDSDIVNTRGIVTGPSLVKPVIVVGGFASTTTIAIGKDALENDSANADANGTYTGARNVAIGRSAMYSMVSGTDNTAIGDKALENTTSATDCVAVGSEAAQNNNADYTVAVGFRALEENTTGEDNVAFGAFTLEDNQTGNRNTAIGYSALEEMINQDDNTAVGFRALEECQDGSFNTALGSGALANNFDGSYNTAVGYSALTSTTSGADNTAVGERSLILNETGQGNVAVGASSMTALISGNNNTAIGTSAGNNGGAGSNNIMIGHNAVQSSSSISNEVTIGNTSIDRFRVPGVSLEIDSVQASIDRDVSIAATTASTSTSTGALVVSGGAGVGGDINVSNIVLGGSGTIGGSAWTNGTFHLGDSVSGWAMDASELYNGGAAVIGTLSGSLTLNPQSATITSKQFQSSVSTGTAPFTVASTTLVTNLNADTVDGYNGVAVYDRNGTLLN